MGHTEAGERGRRRPRRAAFVAATALGLVCAAGCAWLAPGTGAAPARADEAASFDMATWTAEADCALCHAAEVATFAAADDGEGDGAGQAGEAADASAETKNAEPDGKADDSSAAEPADSADDGSDDENSLARTGMIAQVHGFDCTVCHDEDALTELHRSTTKTQRKASLKLKNAVSNETCLMCHDSYEALAEQTAESTYLTDDHGLTVNPHDVPAEEGHDDPIACTSCHSVHKEYEPIRYCYGCHHADVFECNTCHEV